MKARKKSISLLIFIIMTISFAVVLLVVHGSLNSYVRGNAEATIENATMHHNDDDNPSLFQLMYISTSEDDKPHWKGRGYFNDEQEIIEWCRNHADQKDEIGKAMINGQTYYILQDAEMNFGRTSETGILCVNVTAAIWMIRMTEVLLLVVMGICIAIATLIGHRAGNAIEREQERQKKFFENASHELKTPLMSIKGFSEGLQKGILPDPYHACEVISSETERMTVLVDDILELSKADRGEDELRIETLSVSELVGDCLDILEAEIRRRNLVVHIEIDDAFINADIEKMKRAVTNILTNAVRYAESEIRITFCNQLLLIEDDGRFLSEEELKHVFDRFHTGEGGNTGIGMALAKEITEQHGFTLRAENTDHGVCFSILFTPRQRCPLQK